MADTYTLLEKITVGAAGATDVTFTSIPQTYTDLNVVISARGTHTSSENILISLNGSTANFSGRYLYTNTNGTISSGTDTRPVGAFNGSSTTSSTFSNVQIYFPNYAGSANKSFSVDSVAENNATASSIYFDAKLWSNTAAITSITFTPELGNFAQYTTFYLYGIAKEGVNPTPSSAPYATGGDSILFDGTYWIHTFTSSGTFTPKKALSCDYLVVAGGGGGGCDQGGGGGAGGFRTSIGGSTLSLTAQAYAVTVGAGGAGSSNTNTAGTSGSSSIFSTITSAGGGGGASASMSPNRNGLSGGSGGGGSNGGSGGTGNTPTTSPSQGNNGGSGYSGGFYNAGGGGGAGAAGSAGSSSNTGGQGGNGTASSISGTSITYAGGGGGGLSQSQPWSGTGGQGGSGGGGRGGANGTTVTAGTVNLGGGGGGGSGAAPNFNGQSGGSGIVIVRYAA
jgi:hypothetical protein